MSRKLPIHLMLAGGVLMATVACAPVQTATTLATPASGAARVAGPGDVVMDFQSRRALPNAFGGADIFGRTTDAGRTTVRYLGSQGQVAVFERADISIQSNATTMTETPLLLPQTSRTSVRGTIGTTPIAGSATSTSYQYIAPRPSSAYATASPPIQIRIASGQSVTIQGHTLRVGRVTPTSVEYSVR